MTPSPYGRLSHSGPLRDTGQLAVKAAFGTGLSDLEACRGKAGTGADAVSVQRRVKQTPGKHEGPGQ
jgi:hypothetical protein